MMNTCPYPIHLRDTHYKGHEKIQSGQGYKYPHDYDGHYIKQEYAPKSCQGKKYYIPTNEGFEERIRQIRKDRGI